jgi:hypothetical protein
MFHSLEKVDLPRDACPGDVAGTVHKGRAVCHGATSSRGKLRKIAENNWVHQSCLPPLLIVIQKEDDLIGLAEYRPRLTPVFTLSKPKLRRKRVMRKTDKKVEGERGKSSQEDRQKGKKKSQAESRT